MQKQKHPTLPPTGYRYNGNNGSEAGGGGGFPVGPMRIPQSQPQPDPQKQQPLQAHLLLEQEANSASKQRRNNNPRQQPPNNYNNNGSSHHNSSSQLTLSQSPRSSHNQPPHLSTYAGMSVNFASGHSPRPQYYNPRPAQQQRIQQRPIGGMQMANIATYTVPSSLLAATHPSAANYGLPHGQIMGVIPPVTFSSLQTAGRHGSHGHGGGQGGGASGGPPQTFYLQHPPPQAFMTAGPPQPAQHPIAAASYSAYPSPANSTEYMRGQLVLNHYPIRATSYQPNSGPHQGVPPQPPPQQPQQPQMTCYDTGNQYVMGGAEGGVGGGGPGGGAAGMVALSSGGMPGLAPSQQQQSTGSAGGSRDSKRRPNAIPIIDPDSGRNVLWDYLSETSETESTASSTATQDAQVVATFAALVAAAAVDNEDASPPQTSTTLNGPRGGGGGEDTGPLAATPVEAHPPAPEARPQPSLHQPHHQTTPSATQLIQPPPPPVVSVVSPPPSVTIIPTVSAMTDSPSVELPRLKGPTGSGSHSPARKPTPHPAAVQPILDKKKEKKVIGVSGGLPSHREESPQRRSNFADSITIRDMASKTPIVPQVSAPQPPPPPVVVAVSSAAVVVTSSEREEKRERKEKEEVTSSTKDEEKPVGVVMAEPAVVQQQPAVAPAKQQEVVRVVEQPVLEVAAKKQPVKEEQQPAPQPLSVNNRQQQAAGPPQPQPQPPPPQERGKTLPGRHKQKKKNLKELNRRGLEKEGGSDMDAFTSPTVTPPPVATVQPQKAASPPPPPPPEPVIVAVAEEEPPVVVAVTAEPPVAPVVAEPPVAAAVEEPSPPPRPSSPLPPLVPPQTPMEQLNNKQTVINYTQPPQPTTPVVLPPLMPDLQHEEDGVEEVEEESSNTDEDSIVAAKNEENAKLSASAGTGEDFIKTTVIERSKPASLTLKFSYKEDQWSPLNPEGKKVYDRDFLLGLRTEALSVIMPPELADCDIIKTENSNNNNNMAATNNNRRSFHGSNSLGMNRGDDNRFAPSFMRSSSSQRGGMMSGKRGSQQGRPGGGGGRSGKGMYPSSQYSKDPEEELHWISDGWKPDVRNKAPPKMTEEEIKTEQLYKKIRGILNKLTPQKFETLMEQIMALPIDTPARLRGTVQLVFDKAVDEPSFSRAYAELCQNLAKIHVRIQKEENEANEESGQPKVEDRTSFRKVLLTLCQSMFEKKKREETGEDGKKSEEERIADMRKAVTSEDHRDKKKELQLMLEEEERKIRVKYVGLARFIGELFKLNMLTANIMHGCIRTLLEKIEEESLECLCKLLSTVGKELEKTSNSKELDEYFLKMRKLSQKNANSKVSSRVRFMLQDVIELRSNKWVPRRDENNPKTMEQIQRDAERETMMESALLTTNTPRSKHGDRDDRRRVPRAGGGGGGGGNNQNDPEGWVHMPSHQNKGFRNYSFDSAKLQQQLKVTADDSSSSTLNLGSAAAFSQWNTGANAKRQEPNKSLHTTNKFALLSQDERKMTPMMSTARKVTPSSSQEKERAVQGVRDAFGDRDNRGGPRSGGGNQGSSNPPSRDSSRVRSQRADQSSGRGTDNRQPMSTIQQSQATTITRELHQTVMSGQTSPLGSVVSPIEVAAIPAEVLIKSEEELCRESKIVFEEWIANHNVQETLICIREGFPDPIDFVRIELNKCIEGRPADRATFSQLLSILLDKAVVSSFEVAKQFQKLLEISDDLLVDVPLLWRDLAEILVPILAQNVFTFADLKASCEPYKPPQFGKTVAEIFKLLIKEKGPVFIKTHWETSAVQLTDFIPEEIVDTFIKDNGVSFLTGEGEVAPAGGDPPITMHRVEDKLIELITTSENDQVFDIVCGWIKANISEKTQNDVEFIRALTRAIMRACIKNDKLVQASLTKQEKLIKRFVDTNEAKELACLHGIQNLVVVQMEHPKGLLMDIFQMLWENGTISHDGFMKWKTCEGSAYESKGKGVAISSLNSFFVSLSEQDDTDDDLS